MLGRIYRKIKTTVFKLLNGKVFGEADLYEVPRVYFMDRVKLGKRVHINDSVFLHAAGGITIGDDCVLSHGVSLISTGLKTADWANRDRCADIHVDKPIVVGENVWLGANVTVCAGVTIAPNCIVAAGAVVTKDLQEENCLYGGIPAVKIKSL